MGELFGQASLLSCSAGKGKGHLFNSLCGTESVQSPRGSTENKALLGMAMELQKMITLNITFSTVGLKMDIDLAKASTPQCLISQNHRI